MIGRRADNTIRADPPLFASSATRISMKPAPSTRRWAAVVNMARGARTLSATWSFTDSILDVDRGPRA